MSSVDPFDSLEIFRIARNKWGSTPESPGIYLLYGTGSENRLQVYIGMSTTNMRSRIRNHHANPRRNWFGVIFAIPVASPILCPAIEAELIAELNGAGVVEVIANTAEERRNRDVDDVHIEPAVNKIRASLQLLLGSDIFIPPESEEASTTDPPIERIQPLARQYRGPAASPRPRTPDDPEEADHAYVGAGLVGWGCFEGPEPDKRFRVLAGSQWRTATLDPEAVTYENQQRLTGVQTDLRVEGILEQGPERFAQDHVFDNWTVATRVISGKSSYSGGYHWQRLEDRVAS